MVWCGWDKQLWLSTSLNLEAWEPPRLLLVGKCVALPTVSEAPHAGPCPAIAVSGCTTHASGCVGVRVPKLVLALHVMSLGARCLRLGC